MWVLLNLAAQLGQSRPLEQKLLKTKKKTEYVFVAVREALFARSALPRFAALCVCFREVFILWCLPGVEI